MTKFISFLSILFALVAIPMNAQAAEGAYMVTTAKAGLNVRDASCNIKRVLPYGELVQIASGKTVTCKINGMNKKFVNIDQIYGNSTGEEFVSEDFLQTIVSKSINLDGRNTYKVDAVGGLNIRDANCKIIGAVANNSDLSFPDGVGGGMPICQRDGKFYQMNYVMYKGKVAYAAAYYLK